MKRVPTYAALDLLGPAYVWKTEAFAAGQPVVLRTPADAAAQAYINLATLLSERFR